jgi:hypothetical protein
MFHTPIPYVAQQHPVAPAQAQGPTEPALRDELLRMELDDQDARMRSDPAVVARIDARHRERLIVILQGGWPGYHRVGLEGSHAAWLLIQHQDGDRALQHRAIEALRAAVEAGDAAPTDLAYLTDRVLVGEGKPQVYGTQCQDDGKRTVMRPVDDPAHLDARRRSVGLEPESRYLARMQRLRIKGSDPSLARELLDMEKESEALSLRLQAHPDDVSLQEELRGMRLRHRVRLDAIMASGWPGDHRVGIWANQAALVLVLGQDRTLRERCLPLLRGAVEQGEAERMELDQLERSLR